MTEVQPPKPNDKEADPKQEEKKALQDYSRALGSALYIIDSSLAPDNDKKRWIANISRVHKEAYTVIQTATFISS